MYNTKYECRYYKNDVFLESDDVSNDEKDFIRSILYREDLRNIFYINDQEDLNFGFISELYNTIYKSPELMECMKLAAAKIFSEDEGSGLCILYSFDYMYLVHKCVSSYLDNGIISVEDLSTLKNALHNT
jgi:hypothetical protein